MSYFSKEIKLKRDMVYFKYKKQWIRYIFTKIKLKKLLKRGWIYYEQNKKYKREK